MDDEPLDDLRAAAMTGGAAAARVAEILARDLQTRTQQRQDEQRRQGEMAFRSLRPEEAQTRSWVAPDEENNLHPGWYEERERPEDAAAFETDVAQRVKDLPQWESRYLDE